MVSCAVRHSVQSSSPRAGYPRSRVVVLLRCASHPPGETGRCGLAARRAAVLHRERTCHVVRLRATVATPLPESEDPWQLLFQFPTSEQVAAAEAVRAAVDRAVEHAGRRHDDTEELARLGAQLVEILDGQQ